MRILLTLILMLPISISIAQIEIVPTGTNASLSEIKIKHNKVFILGSENFVGKCDQDCNSVISLVSPEDSGYSNQDLNILDTNNLFLLSTEQLQNSRIYHSSDGGMNWQTLVDTNNLLIVGLAVFDSLRMFAPATFYESLLTVNGGQSWFTGSHSLITVGEIHILNDSTVIMGVLDKYRISEDYGNSWNGALFEQATPRAFWNIGTDTIFTVSSHNLGNYYSYSYEKGLSNSWIHSYLDGIDPYGVHALSSEEIYIVGRLNINNNGVILKSTNEGQSWYYYDTGFNNLLTDIKFLNDSIAIVSGSNGLLFKWNKNSPMDILSISKVDFGLDELNLFPNPSESTLTIQFKLLEKSKVSVEVIDLQGRVIQKIAPKIYSSGKQSVNLNVTPLSKGLYTIRLKADNHYYNEKFLKK